ncbi:toll/interleukin-1 receptor domain-containing protein [Ideonella sp. 4Y11]|uniref:Toll/interleukin-1 receptor domain-containing protein n=1 Tax=Ideonella aquatica TaxID=2824119 RepID=A0A941BNB3_9BURK|nr:toll/interleukin-1 receptor domain-containing protein [Ideonella aquatica]MBQ0961799.1 toll/interleukin-1 receptor domain-containing protein [Ideonella aquatica]
MSEQSAEFNDERMNTRYGVLLEQYRSAGPSPLLERVWAQEFPGYQLAEYNTLVAASAPADVLAGITSLFNQWLGTDHRAIGASDEAGKALVTHLGVWATARFLRSQGLRLDSADGIARVPRLSDLESAFLAAAELGEALVLECVSAAGRSDVRVGNLVTDTEEVQLGVQGPAQVYRMEIHRKLMSHVAGSEHVPSDALLRSQLQRYERRTGHSLIVVVNERPDVAAALRQGLNVGVVSRVDQSGLGSIEAWIQDLRSQVHAISRMVIGPQDEPPPKVRVSDPPVVFVSYASKNRQHRQALDRYTQGDVTANHYKLWIDDQIDTGDDWEPRIMEGLAKCSVAVLLMTPDFFGREFIVKKELPALAHRKALGEVTVLPIMVELCRPMPPVDQWQIHPSRSDELLSDGVVPAKAWMDVAQKLADAAAKHSNAPTP